MEDFRKFLAARLARQQTEADTHPAPDLLAAFAEARLRNNERKQILTHLAVCGACRDVLAFMAADRVSQAEEKPTTVRWWNVRWASAFAAACVVGVVIWRANPPAPPVVQRPAIPAQPVTAAPKIETAKSVIPLPSRPRQKMPRPVTPQAAVSLPELPAPPAPSVDEIAKAGQTTTLATEPLEPGSLKAFEPAPQPTFPAQAMALKSSRAAVVKALVAAPRRQSLWSIASNGGQLQRSNDQGKTWTAIPIPGQAVFLALAVSGPDIWAGGEGGALFHSTDDGFDWEEVAVTDGAERLTASIVAIETQGSQVKVRTKSGNWISPDNGVSWRKMAE